MASIKRTGNISVLGGTPVIEAIVTEEHVAMLVPAVSELESMLQYTRRTFVVGGPLGFREVENTVWLCDFDALDRLRFPAGLLPRVRRVLQEHGYRVHVEDRRKLGPRLTVDESVLYSADDKAMALLHVVVREPLGQIETANSSDAIEKMLLVGEVFPDARVVVAVATRRQAWSLWKKLKKLLGGSVGLALPGVKKSTKTWLIGTFGCVPRNEGEYDILLLPSAEETIGHRAIDMVVGMHFRRIYAFIQPCRRPDALVQIRLEPMAGPVIHRLKKAKVPVRVFLLPTPSGNVAGKGTALQRKRALYWHNDTRNDVIVAVAKAFSSGDRVALKALGMRNKDIRVFKRVDKHKIAVLVESPEHGRELLARLPDWNLLSLVPGDEATTDDESITKIMPTVVTTAYAAKHTIRANIVIRATGTGWELRLKGFPPRKTKQGPSEVFVIDFEDNFHTEAKENTRHRVQEYERRGVKIFTLKPGGQGINERNSSEGA